MRVGVRSYSFPSRIWQKTMHKCDMSVKTAWQFWKEKTDLFSASVRAGIAKQNLL